MQLFKDSKIVWFSLLISAVLYALPFLFNQAYFLSFSFLFIIFFISQKYNLSFFNGFIWGSVTFALQLSGIFYSLFRMADYNAYIIILIALPILAYCGLVSGLWFSISTYLSGFIKSKFVRPKLISLLIWVITSELFFEFVYRAMLFPFGVCEGYILAHPLLPMTNLPILLKPLPTIGITALTGLFCIFTGILAYIADYFQNYLNQNNSFKGLLDFKTFKGKKNIFKILIIIIFLILLFKIFLSGKAKNKNTRHNSQTSELLKSIIYIPESFYSQNSQKQAIELLSNKLKKAIKDFPEAKLILLPESSLYLCDLTKKEFANDLEKLKTKDNSKSSPDIILGALRTEDNKAYNTIYWLKDGKIKSWFDKRHALVLTERLPQWASSPEIKKLYYTIRPFITPGQNPRPIFNLSNKLSVIPFICSEIFFINKPDFNYPNNFPIVSFSNDTWIFAPYIENLMRMTNKFRAIEWNRDIIYISYSQGLLFLPDESVLDLQKA